LYKYTELGHVFDKLTKQSRAAVKLQLELVT